MDQRDAGAEAATLRVGFEGGRVELLVAGERGSTVVPDGPEQGWRTVEMDKVIARGDALLREYEAGSDGPEAG